MSAGRMPWMLLLVIAGCSSSSSSERESEVRSGPRGVPRGYVEPKDAGDERDSGFVGPTLDAGTRDAGRAGGATPPGAGPAVLGSRSDGGGLTYTDASGLDAEDDGATPAPPTAAPAQAGCPDRIAYAIGMNRVVVPHGPRQRAFEVYVPASLATESPAALVLDFHAQGSSPSTQEAKSGWRELADAQRFLVAYPEGLGASWNAGSCCGRAASENADDVGFARSIAAEIGRSICVDARRVYATGFANGGALAHRIGCEAADVFAAVAAASADLLSENCRPVRSIAELSVRGQNDMSIAYEGGNTGATGGYTPGAQATFERWRDVDACAGAPESSGLYCQSYQACRGGVEVALCSLPGTGHDVYTNALDFSVASVAWDMFQRQAQR